MAVGVNDYREQLGLAKIFSAPPRPNVLGDGCQPIVGDPPAIPGGHFYGMRRLGHVRRVDGP